MPVVANLRHHEVDALNDALAAGEVDRSLPFAVELDFLHRLAVVLEAARGKSGNQFERTEYSFQVADERVAIIERKRGSPLDKLVAELMILVNRSWGKLLDERGAAAIYRAQAPDGKVRMTTVAAEHQGLGVSHYAWSSSPLRRYVDLVNQWQLVAMLQEAPAAVPAAVGGVARGDARLRGHIRRLRRVPAPVEYYWCLRWLIQEGIEVAAGEVVRENLVKIAGAPLYVRVPSLPELPPGTPVEVEIAEVDLIDTHLRCVYKNPQAKREVA